MSKITKYLFLVLLVSGCSQVEDSRNGSVIDVYPVTYSQSFEVVESKEKIEAFVERYQSSINEHGLTITHHISLEESRLNSIKQQLLGLGLTNKAIFTSSSNDKVNAGDITLSTTAYKVVAELCEYSQFGEYQSELGCSSEGLRWKSMVNPQRMLNGEEPLSPSVEN